jgi:hypothetical protein
MTLCRERTGVQQDGPGPSLFCIPYGKSMEEAIGDRLAGCDGIQTYGRSVNLAYDPDDAAST